MNIAEVVELIRSIRVGDSISAWPDYAIQQVPFAVYDDQQVVYIGHPDPPAERPQNLMAATSIDINGTETATIPVHICSDEETTLLLAYHEGFHVFQHHRFVPLESDMFTAMSYYPELDADYRTLCQLEIDVLRSDWSSQEKLQVLGNLIAHRRTKLNHHDSLLSYERFLERSEGTATFVEQKSRAIHFGIEPILDDVGYGWARFYKVGSALCWLLGETTPGWTRRIEEGESPGDLVIEHRSGAFDLERLNYARVKARESESLRQLHHEIDAHLDALKQAGTIRIQYGGAGQILRAFNPSTLVSLGDGRVLHRSFFKLLLPGRGSVNVHGFPVIDHVSTGEVHIMQCPYTLIDGQLSIQTDDIQAELADMEKVSGDPFLNFACRT